MRHISAASHGTRSTVSQDTDVRTSTNVRPSWLAGHWVTPKSSRFQPMHDDDIEKGRVEITEVSDEENITEKPRTLSPETTPRSAPHHIHPASSSTIPLNAIGTTKSTIHFANDSISSDSLLSSENKHTSLTNITRAVQIIAKAAFKDAEPQPAA